ncbi:MAG: hypothetical protein QXF12_00835 [Candidatus Aenigmatarchaeota archaeon]
MTNISEQKSIIPEKEKVLEILDEISKNFRRSINISFARPLYYLEGDEVKKSIHNRNILMLLNDDLFYRFKSMIHVDERYDLIGSDTAYILEVPSLFYKINYIIKGSDKDYNEYGLRYVRTSIIREIIKLHKLKVWWKTEEYLDRLFYTLMKNNQFLYYALEECYNNADKVFRMFLKQEK